MSQRDDYPAGDGSRNSRPHCQMRPGRLPCASCGCNGVERGDGAGYWLTKPSTIRQRRQEADIRGIDIAQHPFWQSNARALGKPHPAHPNDYPGFGRFVADCLAERSYRQLDLLNEVLSSRSDSSQIRSSRGVLKQGYGEGR